MPENQACQKINKRSTEGPRRNASPPLIRPRLRTILRTMTTKRTYVRKSLRVPLFLVAAFAAIVVLSSSVPLLTPTYAYYEEKTSLISKFKTLVNNHPSQSSYVSVGRSHNGQSIWLFRFGNPSGKRILWDGQLHGAEDLGSQVEYYMAKWLLESGNSRATIIMKTCYVLLLPVANPDSYGRGNRNTYSGSAPNGVDINRNFRTNWSSCSSSSRTSVNYRGPYAASEKETQVLRSVFSTYRPRFYVNTHEWGGPYFAYYKGDDSSIVTALKSRISKLSSEMGVTPYSVASLSGYGQAVADAHTFGATSWLLELNGSGTPSYSSIFGVYFKKCLPILIAMSQT